MLRILPGLGILVGSLALIGCGPTRQMTDSQDLAGPPPAYREPMRSRIVEWENNPQLKWAQQDEEMVATIMNSDPTYDLAVGAFLGGAIKTNALSPDEALTRMDEWQKRWPDRTETWQVTRDMVNRLKQEAKP